MADSVSTQELINQLEKLSQRLLEIVARDFPILNEKQFNWKEYSDRWSIVECFIHLNKVFDVYFPKVKSLLENPSSSMLKQKELFQPTWFGNRFLKNIQLDSGNQAQKIITSPSKYAPDLTIVRHNGVEIINTFLRNQQTLLHFLASARLVNIQKIKLPAALKGLIKISLGDLLKILVYHTERHVIQAQRILYQDDFPSNTVLPLMENGQPNLQA